MRTLPIRDDGVILHTDAQPGNHFAPRPSFRMVDVPASAARANTLINALIEQLPEPGTDWPADQRDAWLHMMETAFTVVYGAPGGGTGGQHRKGTMPKRAATKAARSPRRPAPAKVAPAHPYVIDLQGFARDEVGNRIMPSECLDAGIFDRRGETGDLGAIIWADDSRGVKGLQLDIQTSE